MTLTKPLEEEYDITKQMKVSIVVNNSKMLVYGRANTSLKQNYILAGNRYLENATEFSVSNKETGDEEEGEGSLKIYKYQINTTENGSRPPLEGVVFDLYNSPGQLINTGTTDANGKIFWDNLELGTYFVEEVYNWCRWYWYCYCYCWYITHSIIVKIYLYFSKFSTLSLFTP